MRATGSRERLHKNRGYETPFSTTLVHTNKFRDIPGDRQGDSGSKRQTGRKTNGNINRESFETMDRLRDSTLFNIVMNSWRSILFVVTPIFFLPPVFINGTMVSGSIQCVDGHLSRLKCSRLNSSNVTWILLLRIDTVTRTTFDQALFKIEKNIKLNVRLLKTQE